MKCDVNFTIITGFYLLRTNSKFIKANLNDVIIGKFLIVCISIFSTPTFGQDFCDSDPPRHDESLRLNDLHLLVPACAKYHLH